MSLVSSLNTFNKLLKLFLSHFSYLSNEDKAFNKHILSTDYLPSTMLAAGDINLVGIGGGVECETVPRVVQAGLPRCSAGVCLCLCACVHVHGCEGSKGDSPQGGGKTDSVLRDKAEPTVLTEKAEQRGNVPRAHTASLRGGKEIIHTSEKS